MKVWIVFIILLLLLSACGGSENHIVKYEIIHRSLHIGEYLSPLPNEYILSVSRDTESENGMGLVSINPKSFELEVIHPEAKDARELQTSSDLIAYRSKNQVHYIDKGKSFYLPSLAVTHLRGFQARESSLLFVVEDLSAKTRFLCFDRKGNQESERIYDLQVLAEMNSASESYIYFVRSKRGLEILEFSKCPELNEVRRQLIIPRIQTRYLSFLPGPSISYLFYLDESDGVLKVVHLNQKMEVQDTQIVDGKAHESYVGLDPRSFYWQGVPAISYGDGWKLQPRVAIQNGNTWKVLELKIEAASGFYPYVIDSSGPHLKLLWHNFRTYHKNIVSFEDLAFMIVEWPIGLPSANKDK